VLGDRSELSEEGVQQTDKISANSKTMSASCEMKRRLAGIQETKL
jgi:hypothetical protein